LEGAGADTPEVELPAAVVPVGTVSSLVTLDEVGPEAAAAAPEVVETFGTGLSPMGIAKERMSCNCLVFKNLIITVLSCISSYELEGGIHKTKHLHKTSD